MDIDKAKFLLNNPVKAKDIKRLREKKVKRKIKSIKKKELIKNTNHIIDIKELFDTPCIYKLHANGNVVYIGETKSLMRRILQHYEENTKLFDSFTYEFYEGSDMQRKHKEQILIRIEKPYYNIQHNKNNSK